MIRALEEIVLAKIGSVLQDLMVIKEMWKGLFKVSLFIVVMCIAFPALGKKRNGSLQPYLETRINRDKVVEGEMLIYEVVLISPDSNIAGIELEKNPSFDNLPVSRSAADNSLVIREQDGEKIYSAVIDRFFIDSATAGKYKLEGGTYRIGFGRQVTMHDPFWGPYIADRVEVVNLEAPDLNLNVSSLPLKGKPSDFSGAIGDFSIEVNVPSGELHVGNEAIAIVTITGIGDLSVSTLPDVCAIFNDGLIFRSMTETRNHFVKEGNLCSEIEIECTFVPLEEGEFKIGECSFSYFNPVSRKYVKSVSNPVSINIVSSTKKHSPTQYMDI